MCSLPLVNPDYLSFIIKIVVFEHFRKAGINPKSGTDVINTFNEFKDKVIVAPIEVRTYYLGKKAGRIGEAVSMAKQIL